jgi:isocitrate dehydrogenase (NAD+)
LLLALGLMLDYVGRQDLAQRLRSAIDATVSKDKIRTGDLGGSASTHAFAEAVARRA